jgi:transcriptional regulator with XRE-family HTH domain
MSSEEPSKAEQEGLHNYGGGFQDPSSYGMSTGDYSESTVTTHQESPLELPASTSAPARVPVTVETVEGLTIAEAATAYGLSVSSIRRLLKAGKIPGAAKIPGAKGAEYRIPPASLESLGYSPKATQSGAILTAARASLEAEELARQVRELEASLGLERLKRELSEERERLKEQQIADLRSFNESLRMALEKLPSAIDGPKRRGLFRRK